MYSSTIAIVNCLADSFAAVASTSNYSDEYSKVKCAAESINIPFVSDNNEKYNEVFTLAELKCAISSTSDTSPGPDKIDNLMLRKMHDQAQQHMLELFNHVWEKCYFPNRWREATIIPIPKPQKDHSNPLNYRPIALTSCLCKLFERMINNRHSGISRK